MLFAVFFIVIVVLIHRIVIVENCFLVGLIVFAAASWRYVGFLVEIIEQHVEEDGIGQCEADRPSRVAAFRPQ